jgi:hypothetical protein
MCLLVIARTAVENTPMPKFFESELKKNAQSFEAEMRGMLFKYSASFGTRFSLIYFILMHLGIECFQLNLCRKI